MSGAFCATPLEYRANQHYPSKKRFSPNTIEEEPPNVDSKVASPISKTKNGNNNKSGSIHLGSQSMSLQVSEILVNDSQ